jgi:hypothetical protein
MTTHQHQLEQRTQQVERVYLKLQRQQEDMEKLSANIHQQQTSLQDLCNTFQKHVMAERHETKNIRDETRKGFKWDIDQVS